MFDPNTNTALPSAIPGKNLFHTKLEKCKGHQHDMHVMTIQAV